MISLWWDDPPLIHQNGIIQSYAVHILEMQTGRFWRIYSVESTILVGALHPYYVYECNVAAITVRAGPFANVNIRTNEARKPTDIRKFVWLYTQVAADYLSDSQTFDFQNNGNLVQISNLLYYT